MGRKLASIQKITDIKPIVGADKIVLLIINNGWGVIASKTEFTTIGELVVYLEIDSWVPKPLAPFLVGEKEKSFNGVVGALLKTIKLKGVLSQGLVISLNNILVSKVLSDNNIEIQEGVDLTSLLNIQKWEEPEIAGSGSFSGSGGGTFPNFLQKTDQERAQNLNKELFDENSIFKTKNFEVSIKLDGSSMTVYSFKNKVGVCSRNLDLIDPEEKNALPFWQTAKSQNLITALQALNKNIAIQGELIGEGIQKNPENLKSKEFHLFDIYDIDNKKYFNPSARIEICKELEKHGAVLNHVPILETIPLTRFKTIDDLLQYAEGPSLNKQVSREGLVFKISDDESEIFHKKNFSFKIISNSYLLKKK